MKLPFFNTITTFLAVMFIGAVVVIGAGFLCRVFWTLIHFGYTGTF